MRIVAGELRGRVIEAPQGMLTRPTTDRVRESLFSSLYSARGGLEGAVVLDAFAGSGALGLEALSRGAAHAVFFESDASSFAVCRKNVEACGMTKRAEMFKRDVLQAPPKSIPPFDLVLLDPPYSTDPVLIARMLEQVGEGGSLKEGALISYEHALKDRQSVEQAMQQAGFELRAEKKYGKTAVTLFNAGGSMQ